MIRIGIAGFGKMGQIRAKEISRRSDVELVAVLEQIAVSEGTVHHAVKCCSSFDELLSCQLDAIFVCAFNDVAAQYTVAALGAGLHVFCEKPPAKKLCRVRTSNRR